MTSQLSTRLALTFFALLAAVSSLPAVGYAQSGHPKPSTTRSPAAAEFEALCKRELATSEFFGQEQRANLEKQLSEPIASAKDIEILLALAADSVRLGNFDQVHRDVARVLGLPTAKAMVISAGQKRLHMLEGLAHFLAAEDANCLEFNTAASCILPIQPEAEHRNLGPIERAIKSFEAAASLDPSDPEPRWLLNLSHMLAGTYPGGVPGRFLIPPELFQADPEDDGKLPRMQNVGSALGVAVMDLAGGAIADDFDGDGFIDLISSTWDPCSSLRAFRSNGKDGFDDVTEEWGLGEQLGGLNLIHADVNNDGALDIFVLRGAWAGRKGQVRNSLLLNRVATSRGFEDVTYKAGLAHPAYPTQAAAFADYDLDGDLDLYVANESPSSSTDFLTLDPGLGRPYPAQLFANQGERDGIPVFRDVARLAGVQNLRLAKGVAWGDIDNDGDEDLFVSNLGPNRLYINLGNGRFEDRTNQWGVASDSRNFAAWFFDFDNDGDLDLFNADFSVPIAAVAVSLAGQEVSVGHPALFRNDGNKMTNIHAQAGMTKPLLPMGANFGDVDGDGFEDIYLGTGVPGFTAVLPNVFFHNQEGRTFKDATYSSGLGHLQKGHAVAFADLDNDGDLDLFEQLGGAYPYDRFGNALYLNPSNDQNFEQPAKHRFLSLELVGTRANRNAIGARVAITVLQSGVSRTFHRVVTAGGSFGGSSFRLEVGLAQATAVESVSIRWPGDPKAKATPGTELALDHFYRITQAPSAADARDTIEQISAPRIRFTAKKSEPGKGHADHGPNPNP